MSPDSDAAQFVRRHELSPEAIAYKSQRKPSVPIQMPDLTDHAAVARWRAETNALWGEDDDPAVPHRRATAAGVDVTLDLWEHMWHTWHYHDLPEADQALAEAAAFLSAHLTP